MAIKLPPNVVDAYNDPYGRIRNARKKRKEFEKIKKTEGFDRWKKWQYKVQKGKCAYCKIRLDLSWVVTHIDHVTPLYHNGDNSYENYVLSCKRCNLRKYVSNKYVVPQWIKDNNDRMKQTQKLRMIRKKQKALIRDILDQDILEEINKHI